LPDFVDSKAKEIETRLRELNDERTRLEAALTALRGSRRGPGRPAASSARATRARSPRATTTRRPGRPRGSRGGNTRANQALELVRSQPGITIPQLAQAMGIEPNYLYRVLPRLATAGQVRRDGKGWRPAR
jgi:hypothetical protein